MTPLSDEARLSSAIGELRDGSSEPDWRAMEDRLVQAFAAHHRPAPTTTISPPRRFRAAPYWVAAAVVLLATAITFYSPTAGRRTALPKHAEPPASPKQSPAVISEPSPPPPAVPVAPAKPRPRAPRATAQRQQAAPGIRFEDFISLPGAFALPDFESGRIVRVEVPLTMLPAYGIGLVPDATPEAVEADFLIGQDGVPRAIRLASNSRQ